MTTMSDANVNLGRNDDEVSHALWNMQGSLFTMIDQTSLSHDRAGEVSRARERDVDMALCLNPKRIAEEFDRVRRIAMGVGEDAELFVKIRESRDHLSGWKGNAANAFRAHLDRMEFFAAQTQHTAILIALQSLGALFSMAYHMRQSYHDMAVAIQAAALHVIDENNKRDEKLYLAIGKGFVQAALDLPKNLKAAAVNFAVETIGALGDYSIEGDDADLVVDQYLDRSRRLWQTFESNLRQLTDRLWAEHGNQAEAEKEMKVLEPVNVASGGVTDIGGPKFSYAEFYTEEYPKDGPFSGRVAEERTKYAEEKRQHDSEINKRLEDR
jgi:hypothetical protein